MRMEVDYRALRMEAQFDLFLLVLSLDRGEVRSMLLGPGAELAPPDEVPDVLRMGHYGLHPVILMAGRQHSFRLRNGEEGLAFSDLPCLGSLSVSEYMEVSSLIPYVRLPGGRENHNFVHLLYLRKLLPIIFGRILGLNKKRAHIHRTPQDSIRYSRIRVSKNGRRLFDVLDWKVWLMNYLFRPIVPPGLGTFSTSFSFAY